VKNFQASLQLFLRHCFAVLCMVTLVFLPGLTLQAQQDASSVTTTAGSSAVSDNSANKWAIAIHGGAGGPVRGTLADSTEAAYLAKLDEALRVGVKILSDGGKSLDAVEAVVKFMEDCPLFNAGIGAVLNENGYAELDASIMDGQTGMAGAVAGVKTIKNPIALARLVMEKTPHVMLIGTGAEDFAKTTGIKMVAPSYFITPARLEAWKKWKSGQKGGSERNEKHGTVGAVALDQNGNLAAATSTGGMTGKMAGRIGDSPVIGAGTYANNNTCAVSATGHGEYFIRNVVAYDLSAMMQYREMTLKKAAEEIIMEKLRSQKATGGLIAVDKDGNISMPFNTNSMFRGMAISTGEFEVSIY
jgi:beta-aspartyl-peptidase (threonine type)